MSETIATLEKRYLNAVQLDIQAVQANVLAVVMARGGGKTTGILAPRGLQIIKALPRGTVGFVGLSHRHIKDNIMPNFEKGLKHLGLKRGYHYRVKEFFPEGWGVPMPYRELSDPQEQKKYVMHFSNGTILVFISQHNAGSSNGMDLDAIIVDEARYIDFQKLKDETLPAVRGNEEYFRNHHLHGSYTFVTDRPRSQLQAGIYEYRKLTDPHYAERNAKQVEVNERMIHVIKGLAVEVNALAMRLRDPDLRRGRHKVEAEYERKKKLLSRLRYNAVHYVEADIFSNLHVLGVDKIRQEFQGKMELREFLVSRMNIDLSNVMGAFYPLQKRNRYLDRIKEAYQSTSEPRNWLFDDDLNPHLPLYVAADYNADINSLVVAQVYPDEIRFIKAMYVTTPEKLADLVARFAAYYHDFPEYIHFVYDHTAKQRTAADHTENWERWVRGLEQKGFKVYPIDLGQASTHDSRYKLYRTLLAEEGMRRKIRINGGNANNLWRSMSFCKVRESTGEVKVFKKDKRDERNAAIPAQDATHLSEAADMIVDAVEMYEEVGEGQTVF